MNILRRLNISQRLFFGFTTVFLIFAALSLFEISKINSIYSLTTQLYEHPLTVSMIIDDIDFKIQEINIELREIFLSKNPKIIEDHIILIDNSTITISNDINNLSRQFLGSKEMLINLREDIDKWKAGHYKIFSLISSGKIIEANKVLDNEDLNNRKKIADSIIKISLFARVKAKEFLNTAEQTKKHTLHILYFIFFMYLVITGVIIYFSISSIIAPLHVLNREIKRFCQTNGKDNREIYLDSKDEIAWVMSSFNDMKHKIHNLLKEIRDKEERYRLLFDTMAQGVIYVSSDKHFISANNAALEMCGLTIDQLMEKTASHPDWRIENEDGSPCLPNDRPFIKALNTGIKTRDIIRIFNPKIRDYVWLIINTVPQFNEREDRPYQIFFTMQDITKIKKIEAALKSSLIEKELLLAEIHHRVKNNMAIITSLLSFQRYSLSDERLITIFKESEMRIKSMALIHERLYKTKDYANIDFREYISSLSTTLFDTYKIMKNNIHLNIDVKDVTIGIDTAVPCGLLINELLSNSLKHAFPDKRRGEIYVGMSRVSEDEIELIVRDNGVGLNEGFDVRKTDTIGWHLIMGLSETQLNGQVSVINSNGFEFKVKFHESKKTRLLNKLCQSTEKVINL